MMIKGHQFAMSIPDLIRLLGEDEIRIQEERERRDAADIVRTSSMDEYTAPCKTPKGKGKRKRGG